LLTGIPIDLTGYPPAILVKYMHPVAFTTAVDQHPRKGLCDWPSTAREHPRITDSLDSIEDEIPGRQVEKS